MLQNRQSIRVDNHVKQDPIIKSFLQRLCDYKPGAFNVDQFLGLFIKNNALLKLLSVRKPSFYGFLTSFPFDPLAS